MDWSAVVFGGKIKIHFYTSGKKEHRIEMEEKGRIILSLFFLKFIFPYFLSFSFVVPK
jgi:hypothetical protein